MTIDSADDSKISNRTITTNRISNRTYDSKSNRITKLRRSLLISCYLYRQVQKGALSVTHAVCGRVPSVGKQQNLSSLELNNTTYCISWIILYYCEILIFYISAILYLFTFTGGYKCGLTTFPTRFAHDVSTVCNCHYSAFM